MWIDEGKTIKNPDSNKDLKPPALSAYAPLRQPLFRALWIATVASNLGTWMQEVGAAWLMTSLAPSPTMVALVRTATALPMFLLALPAGALADVIDRRRLLIFTQFWMLASATSLGLLTFAELTTPAILLALTFTLGIGTALTAPAWQAIMPDIVSRDDLHAAISLHSVSINLARSVGPAVGGVVIALVGPGATFLLNALSYCALIVVLYRWRRKHEPSVLPAERVWGAIGTGLRYVRHAPPVLAVLARSGSFIVFGSVLWSLLPALARFEFGRGPAGYGILLALFGVGAVSAATLLPGARARFSVNKIVAAAIVLFAAMLLVLAWVRYFFIAELAMVVAGACWLILLSTFSTSIQAVVPSWVRGRALAVSILVFFGGMALGSVVWGQVAERSGLPAAFTAAAMGALLALLLTRRFRLHSGEQLDLSPSVHWPAPLLEKELEPDHGPVVVTVDYRIDPARLVDFRRAMQRVRRIRLRDGATSWGLLSDVSNPARYMETFVVESWLEHLRQHERVTRADRFALDKVKTFHLGETRTRVTHYIVEPVGPEPRKRRRKSKKK